MNYKPNFGLIELCLTYRCNLKCNNCSNLCTQAVASSDLTPDDIEYFLDDISKADHKVGQITIHGGEPVLNPWIMDIIKQLVTFRSTFGTNLWLLTNNSSPKIRSLITKISCDYSIPLGIATKNGSPIAYHPVNESPEDLGENYSIGCFQTENCGICFNNLGYFPCSPLAAAARVFDYKPTAVSIKQLTLERCNEYFEMHCKHCGFAMKDRRRVTEQTNTETWQKAFSNYQRKD